MSDFTPDNSPLIAWGDVLATSDPPLPNTVQPAEGGDSDDLGTPVHVAVYVGAYGA